MSSRPEPPPTDSIGPDLWPLVIARHRGRPAFCRAALERHDFGVAKYGKSLKAHNGRNALIDALQEALDLVVYLEQARVETASRGALMRLTAMQDLAVDLAQELAWLSGAWTAPATAPHPAPQGQEPQPPAESIGGRGR